MFRVNLNNIKSKMPFQEIGLTSRSCIGGCGCHGVCASCGQCNCTCSCVCGYCLCKCFDVSVKLEDIYGKI